MTYSAGASQPTGNEIGGVGPGSTVHVPRQLKPPPAHFTARGEELAALDRIADKERPGPTVAVISGQGGVGKSALALWWLHSTVDRYPDGQLYADLSAEQGTASVLSQFVRSLGVPSERVPPELAAAAALFRTLTADKRIAILVDNAESAAEVRVLLPASSRSVVVVTTRWRLGGLAMDGAEFLSLVPLHTDAGAELLARTIGRPRVDQEPEATGELVRLCGGLPIALAIAAARLAMRPNWPVSRVVHDLTDERRRLTALTVEGDLSVHSVFDVSYYNLRPREALAYRWLGVCPAPMLTTSVAATALDLSPADAADIMDTLVDASLLEPNGDHVRLHDLVRLHARDQAVREDAPEVRLAVVERTMRHFLRFAAAADLRVEPHGHRLAPIFTEVTPSAHPSESAALDELEQALPNVLAVLRAGSAHRLDSLVWQLCEALESLFLRRKHFPDWFAACEVGIAAATNCGEPAAQARMRLLYGLAHHNLGHYEEAVTAGTAAVSEARAAGHTWLEAEALRLIGMANRNRGDLHDAVAVLCTAVELDATAGACRPEALGRRLLGQTLVELGRLDEAVEQLEHARRLAIELSDTHVAANISVWLADVVSRAGNAVRARQLLEDAHAALRHSGSPQHQAQVLMVWGWVAERDGDFNAARDLLTRAHDLYAGIGAPHVTRVRGDLDRVMAQLAENG